MMNRTAFGLVATALLAAGTIPLAAPQTARTGGADSPDEKTVFRSPMVIETVFAAADASLWDPAKGHKPGAWFAVEEYRKLGRFTCDGVSIRSDDDPKHGTWETGLRMAVKDATGGQTRVKIEAAINNPKGNHDKRVNVRFEILDGQSVIASEESGSFGIEEGDDKDAAVTLTVPAAALKTDPMTRLRLTLTVQDD